MNDGLLLTQKMSFDSISEPIGCVMTSATNLPGLMIRHCYQVLKVQRELAHQREILLLQSNLINPIRDNNSRHQGIRNQQKL